MKKLILSTLLITIVTAPSVWAKNPHRENIRWAKVTKVQPITRVIQQRLPQQECWNEQVQYVQRPQRRNSNTGTILGTIVGGVIGNNITHNRGAGTVIGAVIGASVGNELSSQGNYRSNANIYYENQRHCRVNQGISYQERVLGYNVWYRYQGNEYKTQMDHHPGKRIRVRFSIEPY